LLLAGYGPGREFIVSFLLMQSDCVSCENGDGLVAVLVFVLKNSCGRINAANILQVDGLYR